MKTVVITGSARGFGFAMLKYFRENGYNTVLCDVNLNALMTAKEELGKIKSDGKILFFKADISDLDDIDSLIEGTLKEFGTIDIWINNAAINQFNLPSWDIYDDSIIKLVDIDLKGVILCSKAIMHVMINQGFGQIYNVVGSQFDKFPDGTAIYQSCKDAVNYFSIAMAREAEAERTGVIVGRINPGLMITNFINTSNGDGDKFDLNYKAKRLYNTLGDLPDVVAEYIVTKIASNKKNNVEFVWLTKRKIFWRKLTLRYKRVDFF